MHSRSNTSTPPENMTNSTTTTLFKPVILFNDYASSSKDDTNSDHAALSEKEEKIEKHRVKVRNMLDNNAKLWESAWRYDRHNSESLSSVHNNGTYVFSQEDRQETNTLQNMMIPCSSNSLIDETIDVSMNQKTNSTSTPQTESAMSTYLIQDTQTITSPTCKIEKGKKKSTDKPTSNALMIKLDLKGTQYLFQDESKEFTDFNPETLETHNYDPSNKKRKRENIPKEITDHLRQWLIQHKKHPYPTESEKQELADQTGLMVNQINNWFINARRRILQPMLKNESRKIKIIQDKVFYSNYPLLDQSLNSNDARSELSNYRYSHRRFYRLSEEDNSNVGEPSSSTSNTASSSTMSIINTLEDDDVEE